MAHQSNSTEYQVRVDGKPVWWSPHFTQEEVDVWLKTCAENPNAYVDIASVRVEILVNQGNYERMKKHFNKQAAGQE